MRRYTLVHQLLRLPRLLILLLTFILIKVFSGNPQLTDWLYSGKIYQKTSRFIASLTRGIPFSVAEYAAYALLGIAAVMLALRILAVVTFRKDSLMRLLSIVITIVLTAAYLVFLFYVLWGFNFYRTSIDKRLSLPEREYTSNELYTLCLKLADDASSLRAGLDEDEHGVLKVENKAVFDAVKAAYTSYGAEHELFSNPAPGIKPVANSKLLSKLRILGIYSGFTSEPNVNTDQPSLYLGYSAAHETAHYYGWARENEANFIAYMVCCRSDDDTLAYSVTMHALTNCSSALKNMDAGKYSELRAQYSEAMLRDLAEYSEYYSAYASSKAGDISDKVNDSYLKANGQEAGIASYDKDVELLLRFFDAKGLFGY